MSRPPKVSRGYFERLKELVAQVDASEPPTGVLLLIRDRDFQLCALGDVDVPVDSTILTVDVKA